MDKKLKKQLSEIKLLICDIDGVLTDGSFIKSTSGDELRSFNALDGVGFVMLRPVSYTHLTLPTILRV